MKMMMFSPQGYIKVRIEGLIPPKKYLKRFKQEQKIAAKITENLKKGEQ